MYADVVKRERVKIKVGDCISVPVNYFGPGFEEKVVENGDSRIFGRVSTIEGNNYNSVGYRQ